MRSAWRLLNWLLEILQCSGQNVKPTATLERIRRRNCVDVQTLELKRFSVVLSPSYSTQSNSLSQCPPGTQVPTTNNHGFPSKESSQGGARGAPSYICGFKTPFTNPHLHPFTPLSYIYQKTSTLKLLEGGTIQKRWGTIQKYLETHPPTAHRFALHQLLQLLAVGLSVEGTRRALLQVVLSAQWCSPAMFPTLHWSNSSRGLRNSWITI